MGSSPTRGSSFFLGEVTALGVLCYFALFLCLTLLCLTLLASFFLPSHPSFTYNNDPLPIVQVPHAAFVPSPLLCLFSLGRQTAMVVDVGWQETTVLPVSSSLLTPAYALHVYCVRIHSSECVS